MVRVCVIGAGVSGLSTAYYIKTFLSQKGIPFELKVFEAERVPGGKMRTFYEDGYIIESGPNGFLDNKQDTLDLVRSLGIEERLYPSSERARKRFICLNGRLIRIPESPLSFLLSPILSFRGKIRLLMELFIPPEKGDRDESVSDFARRRIGEEALEKLLEPMVAGVYAGDPDRMSLKASFPTIYALEKRYGGLIRGFLGLIKERRRRGGPAGPGGTLTSFKGGTSDLIAALSEHLEENLFTATPVEAVLKDGDRWKVKVKGEFKDFDVVVLSTPAYVSSKLLSAYGEISELLSLIEYSPISVVALGFDRNSINNDLDGFGFLVPRIEGRRILGALWDSSIFPNRAPDGKALIRVMLGGARQPEIALLDEEELVSISLEELGEIMGVSGKPEIVRVFRHRRGIPHYTIGHVSRVDRIFSYAEKMGNLYLNSNAYRGIGLNDCVANAKSTAEEILSSLTQP